MMTKKGVIKASQPNSKQASIYNFFQKKNLPIESSLAISVSTLVNSESQNLDDNVMSDIPKFRCNDEEIIYFDRQKLKDMDIENDDDIKIKITTDEQNDNVIDSIDGEGLVEYNGMKHSDQVPSNFNTSNRNDDDIIIRKSLISHHYSNDDMEDTYDTNGDLSFINKNERSSGISDYEMLRLENIQRNQQFLTSLGITSINNHHHSSSNTNHNHNQNQSHMEGKKRKFIVNKIDKHNLVVPSRRSTRVAVTSDANNNKTINIQGITYIYDDVGEDKENLVLNNESYNDDSNVLKYVLSTRNALRSENRQTLNQHLKTSFDINSNKTISFDQFHYSNNQDNHNISSMTLLESNTNSDNYNQNILPSKIYDTNNNNKLSSFSYLELCNNRMISSSSLQGVYSLQFHPFNNSLLLAAGKNGVVSLFQINSYLKESTPLVDDDKYIIDDLKSELNVSKTRSFALPNETKDSNIKEYCKVQCHNASTTAPPHDDDDDENDVVNDDDDDDDELLTFQAHNSWISSAMFVRTNTTTTRIIPSSSPSSSPSLSPSSSLLVITASNDGSIKLWDLSKTSTLNNNNIIKSKGSNRSTENSRYPQLLSQSKTIHSKGIFAMDLNYSNSNNNNYHDKSNCNHANVENTTTSSSSHLNDGVYKSLSNLRILTGSKDKKVCVSRIRSDGQFHVEATFEFHTGI